LRLNPNPDRPERRQTEHIGGKPFFELKGTTPGGWAKTISKLEPVGSGTEVFFELDFELPGGFLGQFADKLFVERAIERDVKHSSDNYKAIVEAEIPVHA
jgi:hypothetical protein